IGFEYSLNKLYRTPVAVNGQVVAYSRPARLYYNCIGCAQCEISAGLATDRDHCRVTGWTHGPKCPRVVEHPGVIATASSGSSTPSPARPESRVCGFWIARVAGFGERWIRTRGISRRIAPKPPFGSSFRAVFGRLNRSQPAVAPRAAAWPPLYKRDGPAWISFIAAG